MEVIHLWDDNGRTYAIPDHILDDFEVSRSRAAADKYDGPRIPTSNPRTKESRNPSARRGPSSARAFAMAGYVDAGARRMPQDHAGGGEQALTEFMKSATVQLTIGQLAPILAVRLGEGDHGRPAAFGGYEESQADDVVRILQVLQDPALRELSVRVSLSQLNRLLASI